MSDVGDALSTLCGLVNSLTNVDITSEHLRLAKCNAADESVAETLWSTLRVLSCHATRETRGDVHFRDYDAPSAVKLHLAFLQYPVIEFYSLPQSGQYNRDALIALGWLLGTQNGLTAILRAKLADSILGAECSRVDPPESPSSAAVPNDRPLSTSAKFSSILHLNATVNLNLREINELARERVKLISKVHAASLDVSGLPHLSVSELALTKRLARARVLGSGEGGSSEKDRQQLRQFREIGTLLEANAKWLRKRHIFFNWMISLSQAFHKHSLCDKYFLEELNKRETEEIKKVDSITLIATVIQEHRRSLESNPRVIRTRDLAAFNSLLRHAIRDKLGIVTFEESMDSSGSRNSVLNCPSRAQRSQCNNAEAQSWLNDLSERQDHEEENFQRNKKRLADELKEMLELIPSVVRV